MGSWRGSDGRHGVISVSDTVESGHLSVTWTRAHLREAGEIPASVHVERYVQFSQQDIVQFSVTCTPAVARLLAEALDVAADEAEKPVPSPAAVATEAG
jgi:hypothetical protein